jgi:hypothetical protein
LKPKEPEKEGKVRPVVDSVFKFEDFGKGFERVTSGYAKGKVVVSFGRWSFSDLSRGYWRQSEWPRSS